MIIDKKCSYIFSRLENAGFKAYLVGDCVRDMLMNRPTHNFNITTNALPEITAEIFSDKKVIPTDMKQSTVTVIHEGETFKITTFRIGDSYSDLRRTDNVQFSSPKDDLARRDFTINAIAMDSAGNLYDPFGGKNDIENKIVRCVGNPYDRFTEDALRILRAISFSSVLGFDIEENTSAAALELKSRLEFVSAERICNELSKMIMGDNAVNVFLKYRDIIGQIIPEIKQSFDFEQRSRYHKYNVYEHIVRSVGAVPKGIKNEKLLRTVMLFHDIAKPKMFRLDEKGVGHFKGHAKASAEMARVIMKRMKFDDDTIRRSYEIISRHSDKGLDDKYIKKTISEIGADLFFLLIEARKADNLAKHDFVQEENKFFDSLAEKARSEYAKGMMK